MTRYTYQWRTIGKDDLMSSTRAFKTKGAAKISADHWKSSMTDENYEIEYRICELVSDGRSGMIAQEIA